MPARSHGDDMAQGSNQGRAAPLPEGSFHLPSPSHRARVARTASLNQRRKHFALPPASLGSAPHATPSTASAQAAVQAIAHASLCDWTHEVAEQGDAVTVRASDPAGVVAVVFTLSVGGCGVM
jgi:hypothetical protein